MRCDSCGKFRKIEDIVCIEDADGYNDYVQFMECRFCVSQADYERYFKNQNKEELNDQN